MKIDKTDRKYAIALLIGVVASIVALIT